MDRFILREVQKGEATCRSGLNEDLLSLIRVCVTGVALLVLWEK